MPVEGWWVHVDSQIYSGQVRCGTTDYLGSGLLKGSFLTQHIFNFVTYIRAVQLFSSNSLIYGSPLSPRWAIIHQQDTPLCCATKSPPQGTVPFWAVTHTHSLLASLQLMKCKKNELHHIRTALNNLNQGLVFWERRIIPMCERWGVVADEVWIIQHMCWWMCRESLQWCTGLAVGSSQNDTRIKH